MGLGALCVQREASEARPYHPPIIRPRPGLITWLTTLAGRVAERVWGVGTVANKVTISLCLSKTHFRFIIPRVS